MSSSVSEKVFENKNAKLKAFVSLAFEYAISLAILYGVLLLFAFNKHVDDPYTFAKNYWLLFLAVAVIGTLINALRQKDVIVTVLSKTVDITVGDTNAVFQVKDYVGPSIKSSRNNKAGYELVFAENGNDPDGNTHIALPGIKIRQFKEISDAIMTAKQELSGGNEYEAFKGNAYVRNRKPSFDLKFIFLTFLAILVSARIIAIVLTCFFSSDRDIRPFVASLILLSLIFVFLLINLIRYSLVKEPRAKSLRSLEFESTGLKINNKSYSYKEIESVTMTPPYLTGFSSYHRILSVKTYEAKKPVRFSFGKRIEENVTEEEFAAGCTCSYPELYERIKSDKALTRKFRI